MKREPDCKKHLVIHYEEYKTSILPMAQNGQ